MSYRYNFRPTCPRCGDKLKAGALRCTECGARTGLLPLPPRDRQRTEPLPARPDRVTSERYVVRETQGFRIHFPIQKPASHSTPGIECVVLDTAYNHRVVASFSSESYQRRLGRAGLLRAAREAAATRCDLLNRLDEIAREAQGAVA